MKIKIILLTGAYASGKSHFAIVLKEKLAGLPVRVHDFDENIDVSIDDGVSFFLKLSEKYNASGISLILCGGTIPSEIINSVNYCSNKFSLHTCLLNVDREERKRRILERDPFFFLRNNTANLKIEDFLNGVFSYADEIKENITLSDTFFEIDNTELYNTESYNKLIFWIKNTLGFNI